MLDLELVSTGAPGDPAQQVGNDSSLRPANSASVRYAAFNSAADNLVPEDTNEATDVVVKDISTGVLRLVSSASNGTQGNLSVTSSRVSISGHGR